MPVIQEETCYGLSRCFIVRTKPGQRSAVSRLRFLYSFGALTRDKDGKMFRTQGIVHTIKDGIVINNVRLMEEVAEMVRKSKMDVGPDVVNQPFTVK